MPASGSQANASGRCAATVTGLEIGATQAIAAQARLQGGQIVAERVGGRARCRRA